VSRVTGFTMVEIAISLAIIGLALVAILGVLPLGINVQRDNREETLIDQDATVFIANIGQGARGLDDLTNYVYEITNSWTLYNPDGSTNKSGGNDYTYTNFSIALSYPPIGSRLTNGANIIGLLSTPEYTDDNGAPSPNLIYGGYSNHIVAYVRSLSGPASEKPPQDNAVVLGGSFGYKIICNNTPVAMDTNVFNLATNAPALIYAQQLTANLHELRLTFLWPLLPSGNTGYGRHTFATTVAGQMVRTNDNGQLLYFFQPQSFTNAP
jgi:type II secretory pathway pseudopilin PulG